MNDLLPVSLNFEDLCITNFLERSSCEFPKYKALKAYQLLIGVIIFYYLTSILMFITLNYV